MTKIRPWKSGWEKAGHIKEKSGGQGTISVIYRKGDIAQQPYILKVLNRQKDEERRRRMYREVSSLRTLEHSGIPKFVDSNVEQFLDLDVLLYFVQEYIPGSTLERFVADNSVSPISTIRFLNSLLNTLEYCHERDIYHRDIKPDNIVLRNDDIEFPVLIDFGQSFNQENEELKEITLDEQHLGNRFLLLPELMLPGSNRRDSRSDITVCCGILLFILTKIRPTTLLDDRSYLPHQREPTRKKLLALQGINIQRLLSLFDQAFNVHIDHRFQTIASLREAIAGLLISEVTQANEQSISERLLRIQGTILPRVEQRRLSSTKASLEYINNQIKQILEEILTDLGSDFTRLQGGSSLIINELMLGNTLGIVHALTDQRFTPRFTIKVQGTEIVVNAQSNDQTKNLLRTPLSDPEFNELQRDLVKEYFVVGLESML
jgi:serine/threonine-protein kinase